MGDRSVSRTTANEDTETGLHVGLLLPSLFKEPATRSGTGILHVRKATQLALTFRGGRSVQEAVFVPGSEWGTPCRLSG